MRAIALALLLLSLPACKRKAETPPVLDADAAPISVKADGPEDYQVVLEAVALHTESIEPPAEIFADELGKRLGASLTESGVFAVDEAHLTPGKKPRKARLEVIVSHQLVPDAKDGPAALASAKAHLVWLEGGDELAVSENVLVERQIPPSVAVQPGEVAGHVGRAVHSLIDGLIAKEKLLRGPDEAVVFALSTPDPDFEVWVLRVIAERKIMAARDAVVARLGSERDGVGDAAIQAMVALADQSTVGLLTKKANFTDHENLRVIMEAAIAIGGPDAIEFLEFVASGHPDSDIAERASEGLGQLRKEVSDGEPGQKKPGR